jgi:peptidoglycan-associated lipoprotein
VRIISLNNFLKREGIVKTLKSLAFLALVLGLGFILGCGGKSIQSTSKPYSVPGDERRSGEGKPETRPEIRSETISPDKAAELEREKRIREQELRDRALREKALQDEKARQEALAREATLKKGQLETVYFNYDQWAIREDQKTVLMRNAEWLKANPQARIRLEGNCDQRGTAEYNLALGQKRADAVKTFLEGLGIARNRLETISYGFERPVDRGQNETSWAKNRRVDFLLIR